MRYEAVEIDGRFFILDHRHPEAEPQETQYFHEAELNARVYNLLTGGELLPGEGDMRRPR